MKKTLIALLLALTLVLSVVLVACGDTPEESTNGGVETVTPHPETDPAETEAPVETDGALGVVEDTEEGWGEVHK